MGKTFSRDQWVIQTRGKYRGRLGLVYRVHKNDRRAYLNGQAVVQFGSGGPFQRLRFSSLRLASEEEKEGYG